MLPSNKVDEYNSLIPEAAKDALLVIPVFNEELNIHSCLTSAMKIFPHILVVNDCSTDSTHSICKKLQVTCIDLPIQLGQGGAIQAGFTYFLRHTPFKYLVTMDGDNQHDPCDAIRMLEFGVSNQLQIVFGSRFLLVNSEIPTSKRLALIAGTFFEKSFLGIKDATDCHNGLRFLDRNACQAITPLSCMRMAHATEIRVKASRLQLAQGEFPVSVKYAGKRSQKPINAISILADLFSQLQ